MPVSKLHGAILSNHYINLVIIVQFIPRLCIIFPLNSKIIKNTGVAAKTEWSGAAYNLLLFMLVSHVSRQTSIPFLDVGWSKHLSFMSCECIHYNKALTTVKLY